MLIYGHAYPNKEDIEKLHVLVAQVTFQKKDLTFTTLLSISKTQAPKT
jgi:hypothetical protein